ncbi:O-antigen ligase family protein [Aneurinibacillus terranovensis]|uniref:O-antigen ligase family protein n=1 Tax=Aneurinibacillus terranovensis TaxID=278991 RepID=UPI0004198ACE|nr:O-antigen ligase family protein [Aneurinibacillus terranovensis]
MKENKLNLDQKLMLEHQKSIDSIIINILVGIVALIPLLTRAAIIQHISPVIGDPVLGSGMKADVFTYYKFVFLVIGAVLLLVFFLYKMLGHGYTIQSSYINLPTGALFLLIAISAITSYYKMLSLFGQYNRHDGVITYLCYLVLFFISASVMYSEKKLKLLFYAMYPAIIINAVLGLLYFYGADLLNYSFIRAIILPSDIPQSAIKGGSAFNSTINNPNYVSGISSVFITIFLVKALFASSKIDKAISLLISILSFAMLLTSLSTSGFLTFVVLIPLVLFLIIAGVKPGPAFITFFVAIVAYFGVFTLLNEHNPSVWTNTIGFFMGQKADGENIESKKVYEKANGHTVKTVDFLAQNSPFIPEKVYAAEGKQIKDEFDLPQPGWAAGTGRVYIWEKTFELIKKRPLLGYGLDTLAYHFPQDDPNKISNLHDANVVVDKPHNMYIGLAFGSGILALIAFLFLMIRHFLHYISFIRNRIVYEKEKILAALFTGWCAYLIQAFFNDSIIGTAPIFWILFGVSVAVLRQEKESIDELRA